jgi:hypothetical protein
MQSPTHSTIYSNVAIHFSKSNVTICGKIVYKTNCQRGNKVKSAFYSFLIISISCSLCYENKACFPLVARRIINSERMNALARAGLVNNATEKCISWLHAAARRRHKSVSKHNVIDACRPKSRGVREVRLLQPHTMCGNVGGRRRPEIMRLFYELAGARKKRPVHNAECVGEADGHNWHSFSLSAEESGSPPRRREIKANTQDDGIILSTHAAAC